MSKDAFFATKLLEAVKLIPRENKIIFVSEIGIKGNVKYAFINLNKLAKKNQSNIDLIWLGNNDEVDYWRKKGYKAVSTETNWQIAAREIMSAKVAIYGQHNFQDTDSWFWQTCLHSAIKIQLWHGTPAKQIGVDLLDQAENIYSFCGLLSDTLSFDYVICEGHNSHEVYKQSFPASKVEIFGAIRNEPLIENYHENNNFILKTFKNILIAPTYPEPNYHNNFLTTWSTLISKILNTTNSYVTFKPHPNHSKTQPSDLLKIKNNFQNIENFYFATANDDNVPYLVDSDCLITDYSSIALDYAITRKPIIFYRPNFDNYRKIRKSPRTGVISENMYGNNASNPDECIDIINGIIKHNKLTIDQIQSAHENFLNRNSSEKLWELINSIMEN